jgi:hypothetical protein
MTDLRAAILARCDELEKLATAAATREGGAVWHACYRPNEAAWAWDVAASLDGSGSGIVDGRTEETAAHVAAWDPAAAHELVAGAREICEVHRPHLRDWAMRWERGRREQIGLGPACEGCGFDPVDEAWRHSVGSCPTLRATARMLGVDDA